MTAHNKNHFSPFAVPVSAPTTPAYTTCSRQPSSDGPPPVTPQRIPRAQRHHSQLQNYFRSPLTPSSTLSTPYTPLSLRSSWSSSTASNLTTPGSVASAKRLSSNSSPEIQRTNYEDSFGRYGKRREDSTEDWRSRANENGIRVGSGQDIDLRDEEVLSAPPIFTAHRRPRSQTLVNAPPAMSSPMFAQPHTPVRRTLATLNTPPRASNANLLKMKGSYTDPAYPRRRPAFGQTDLFDIHEDEFVPYPSSFSPSTSLALPLSLNDPFDAPGLPTISETIHQSSLYQALERARSESPLVRDESCCSVCGNSCSSLAQLEPCSHALCSACLTSALNIVGEKDMECAVCKKGVANFHLRSTGTKGSGAAPASTQRGQHDIGLHIGNNVEGQFNAFNFFDLQRSSTPNGISRRQSLPRPGELPVLRIDNVPWDITPPAIIAWLKHPVKRVHVLLDRKGKTLSHAFVEMADEDAARAGLRTAQNSVLGKGKRARGVTVTRSGQEELMKALFPSWQGPFDGSRPSLAGLSNEQVVVALEQGLIPDTDLKALLHLIRSPDSHFLKVPSLPFHSLVSILSKFPADADSRLFWSASSRDMLFAAIQIVASGDRKRPSVNDPDILAQLLQVAIHCEAFTAEQRQTVANLVDNSQPRSPASSASGFSSRADLHTPDSVIRAPNVLRSATQAQQANQGLPRGPFGMLAREFGVEPQLVEALAHRLSDMC
ncbi:hypothetical protein BV25DRAFT_1822416 [Artomyces pyxidatus]|uniref:Uncharacterized protein n=1 Tax=Artomyces pyxidatus TaxID=48021 RepID=A0ACB8TAD8_9AGAM|nr:hypothetical protein BV25DRAFT_1822416 [Artomyces pyxidatus]